MEEFKAVLGRSNTDSAAAMQPASGDRFERVAMQAAQVLPVARRVDRIDLVLQVLAEAEELPQTLRDRLREALGL